MTNDMCFHSYRKLTIWPFEAEIVTRNPQYLTTSGPIRLSAGYRIGKISNSRIPDNRVSYSK